MTLQLQELMVVILFKVLVEKSRLLVDLLAMQILQEYQTVHQEQKMHPLV